MTTATNSFSRTLRSLAADDSRTALAALAGASLLLLGWGLWLTFGSTTVTLESQSCRVEVASESYPIDSPLGGRVAASHLTLGRAVAAGDVLVELDSSLETSQLERDRQRLQTFGPQLAEIEKEIAAEQRALRDDAETTKAALAEASARVDEEDSQEKFAAERARRLSLHKEAFTEIDLLKAESDAEKTHHSSAALSLEVERLSQDGRARESHSLAKLSQLQQQWAQLEGDRRTAEAAVKVSTEEVEKHFVRAPVAGLLGDVATLQAGTVLSPGSHIATIIPDGTLRAIAELPAGSALGRVHPGLRARLRLDGFPWLEYGTVAAEVARVAAEPRNGRLRVELALLPDSNPRITLQHGLSATAEIEIERVTPLQLLLRTVGRTIGPAAGDGDRLEQNPPPRAAE